MINNKNIIYTLKSLNSYKDEFLEDTNLTLENIREKSMSVSAIRSKWLMYLFKEKENLEKIQSKRKEIMSKKLIDSGKDVSVLKIKAEETILKNSEVIQKLNQLEADTKKCLEYIEYAMNILNDFNFQIKNTLDYLKLEKI